MSFLKMEFIVGESFSLDGQYHWDEMSPHLPKVLSVMVKPAKDHTLQALRLKES